MKYILTVVVAAFAFTGCHTTDSSCPHSKSTACAKKGDTCCAKKADACCEKKKK